MKHRDLVFWGFALVLSVSAPLHAVQVEQLPAERAPEIDAQCWFNAQPKRLHDAPRLILLEFWSVHSRESRQFVDVLSKFHEAYSDGRLLIVALTEDQCVKVRNFIHRTKLPYKVGAESRSFKHYGIEDLPSILLIDTKDLRVVARWSGKEVKARTVAQAIQEFLGPPQGASPSPGDLTYEETQLLSGRFREADAQLANLISEILEGEGEIGPNALSPLETFYAQYVLGKSDQDRVGVRVAQYARGAILGELGYEKGYEKLFASGRLNEAAKMVIRDRVLEIAEKDSIVSISAAAALRRFIARPGDPVVLESLRRMLARESSPLVRAAIDDALDELDPARADTKMKGRWVQPVALEMRRKLRALPDPASSAWGGAHAYMQTVSQRTTEQLIEDYWTFPDPPDDEVGIQNATIKRDAAMRELLTRIVRNDVTAVGPVKDHLVRMLSEEPDPFIRNSAAWSGLRPIAERGGGDVRSEIIQLLQERLPGEPDRHVKATIETAISELKEK